MFSEWFINWARFTHWRVALGFRSVMPSRMGRFIIWRCAIDALSDSIARAIAATDPSLILFAPSGSELERAGEANQLHIAHEVFADRNYLADGSLVSSARPDALLKDPVQAAERVIRMLKEGVVRAVDGTDVKVRAETICLHGDNPAAVEFARSLRETLEKEGVTIRPFSAE